MPPAASGARPPSSSQSEWRIRAGRCSLTGTPTACRIGLKIAIADVDEQGLSGTAKEVAQIVGEQNLIALPTDVTKLEQVQRLRDRVYDAWGEVS